MGLFVPALIFIGLAALPTRALGRWAALGGAGLMFAALGVSAAAIFGPDSDTSIHGSNWDVNPHHAFFVGVLTVELAFGGLFLGLAFRCAPPFRVRQAFFGCALAVFCITYALGLALSN